MATATQDVHTIKHERTFEALDADHNGYLDWSDYQNLAERYLTAYQLDREDRRGRALLSFFQLHWLELLRHSGVDGDRLTKDQFVTAKRLAAIDTSRLNLVDGGGQVLFDVIDVDGDNEISQEEFARFWKDVCGNDPSGTRDAFSRMDSDGDGAIARHEFLRAVREYSFSDDLDAPGNQFFGHI